MPFTSPPLTPLSLSQTANDRKAVLRVIARQCAAAAKTLGQRATVLERSAGKHVLIGNDRTAAGKILAADQLRAVARILIDLDFLGGGVDLVAIWQHPTSASRRIVPTAAPTPTPTPTPPPQRRQGPFRISAGAR